MRKTSSVGIAIALLGASLSIPAHAAIKAGSKCTVKGQVKLSQGKQFTCIKSGKKLVWNKGSVTASSISRPEPLISPTPQPSPNKVEPAIALEENFPRIGSSCAYDELLAFRFSLVPGYSSTNELRWLTCNRSSRYELGLDVPVDTKSLTPKIPGSSISSSDLKSYDSIAIASQAFVDGLKLGSASGSDRLILYVENSDYGDYLDLLKTDLKNVLQYYETIGIAAYMPKIIKVFIGKTNSGIDALISTNCRKEGLSIPGGTYASICDDGQTGMIVVNVAANVLGGMVYNQQADLSKVTKSREMILWFRWAVVHEFYHQFQLGVWSKANLDVRSVLPWIVEGSAQTIPFYYLAKSLGTENSYQFLWEVIQLTNLVPPGQGPENGPSGCTNPARMMSWNSEDSRRQCQYTQGMLIVETFIARYGISKWVQLVVGQNSSNINQFEQYFQTVTGEQLDVFYDAADVHSRKMGYQIK